MILPMESEGLRVSRRAVKKAVIVAAGSRRTLAFAFSILFVYGSCCGLTGRAGLRVRSENE